MPSSVHRRNVIGWRRKKLKGGKYLQIAITDKAGPRGGHTVAYVQHKKSGNVYPGHVEESPKRRVRVRRRKHGRQVKVRSRG